MKRATRRWQKKAEADWQMAQILARAPEKPADGVCFHGQQAAEKFLKALLEQAGLPIAKTHQLRDLYHLALPTYARLKSLERGLIFLTQFAVETRYPGKDATWRQAQAALRWAKVVRGRCRESLGLPPG